MTKSYLNILEESLEQKLQIMAEIQKYSVLQQEVFQSQEADLDRFDEYVDKKDVLLQKLTALDSGFEALYRNVSEELKGNREKYAAYNYYKSMSGSGAETSQLYDSKK